MSGNVHLYTSKLTENLHLKVRYLHRINPYVTHLFKISSVYT